MTESTPSNSAQQTADTSAVEYITNPFSIALRGITALKDKANGVFILSLVLGVLGMAGNGFKGSPAPQSHNPSSQVPSSFAPHWEIIISIAIAVLLVVLAFAFVGFLLWGMYSYTAARLAKGEGATISEAFNAVMANFKRLIAVAFIGGIRTLGWYLLFIVPGIIMHVRYSLSGITAFAEPDLKPSQVVSRSAQLTKGAWFDTFGSMTSFGLITFGVMQDMTQIGASAVMYRQLRLLKEAASPKPATHILSYLLLIIPIVLVLIVMAIVIFILVQLGADKSL